MKQIVNNSFLILFCFSLRQIDLELMRRLHQKVNIVPVIAKADTMTAIEIKKLKQRVLADIEENKIQVLYFQHCNPLKVKLKADFIYLFYDKDFRKKYLLV